MKKIAIVMLMLLAATAMQAQRVTRQYSGTSLSNVLADLAAASSRYKISFIYNDLEDFSVTKRIDNLTIPEAITAAIGFYPVRMELSDSLIFVECTQKEPTRLAGRVVDEQRNPVEFANVSVLASADSAFINGGVSNENGNFTIPCRAGEVVMKISAVGYRTLTRRVKVGNMGTLKLTAEKYMLKGVTVKSQRPRTVLKSEGMVTTVAGSVLEKTTDMEQLLDRIPTVNTRSGNIEVFGRGTPLIYINGHRRSMQELMQLTPANVKSVEVIRNPGARYEASATSVLRIVTKKPEGEGFSFDSRTQLKANDKGHFSETERLDMTYRTSRLELKAYLYGADLHTDQSDKTMVQTTKTSDATWRQTSYITNEFHDFNPYGQLSAAYQIDENNSIGARFDCDRYAKQNCDFSLRSETMRNDTFADNSFDTCFSPSKSTALSSNAYYEGKIGELNIDFNTVWYWYRGTERSSTDEQFTEAGAEEQQRNVDTYRRTYNQLVASKLVLAMPLLGGNVSVGGEYSTSARRAQYSVEPKEIVDDEKARIRENMTSAYADYERSFGKLNLQLGLRYEYVDFNYFDHGIRVAEQSRKFNNVFPSVAVSMPVGNVQMQMGYATDIKRPSYSSLRNGVQYDNRYTYESGNPFLVPTISRNMNYALSWKWLAFTAMFTHVKDDMCNVMRTYKDDPRMSLMCIENISSYNTMNATLSMRHTMGVWTPEFEADFFKQWYNMTAFGGRKLRNPLFSFKFNNTFDTKWCTVSLLTSARTEGNVDNRMMQKGSFQTDLSVYRKFLNSRLTVQLYVSDLLHTSENRFTVYSGELRTTAFHFKAQTNVNLNIRYSFNVGRNKYRGTGAGQAQQSRM